MELADIQIAVTKGMNTTTFNDGDSATANVKVSEGNKELAASQEMKTTTPKGGEIYNIKVSEDKPFIAYLHNLSPIKKSQRDNMYFHMTLQTEETTYRSVCFSPEKHQHFLAKYESSSPLKISKFQLKRNDRTNQDEVHINKRTKMEDPLDTEVSFDIKKIESEDKCKPGISTVSEVLEGDTNAVLNVCGRITFRGSEETVLSKGKTLRKQEALFTDNSGTIRLVLWENDIHRVTSATVYSISKIVVREYEKAKYLTLNKMSSIDKSNIPYKR